MVPLGSSETPATEIKTPSHTATEKSATESPAAEMRATGSSDSSPIETYATGDSPTDRTKEVTGHGVTGPPATVTSSDVVGAMTQLIKAHTEAIVAQARAIAVQIFLRCLTTLKKEMMPWKIALSNGLNDSRSVPR